LILACRVADLRTIELRTILACAANDFTVSHETNSTNKMYVARLKKFLLQK
jgi:hypothetical protein